MHTQCGLHNTIGLHNYILNIKTVTDQQNFILFFLKACRLLTLALFIHVIHLLLLESPQ